MMGEIQNLWEFLKRGHPNKKVPKSRNSSKGEGDGVSAKIKIVHNSKYGFETVQIILGGRG